MVEKKIILDASKPLDFQILLSSTLAILFFGFAIFTEYTMIPYPMGRVFFFLISLGWFMMARGAWDLKMRREKC
jgi:hypothetical protein